MSVFLVLIICYGLTDHPVKKIFAYNSNKLIIPLFLRNKGNKKYSVNVFFYFPFFSNIKLEYTLLYIHTIAYKGDIQKGF